ncbi:EFHD2-like protein [Mya arenaria]|uniref:EFHD2-like protein n=1 Tax=Mya arenaria TaxID=6604 RepID=A0ABY7EV56_MYAAR|nr:EFHD2-like protein [Mya arenaria]
MATDELAKKLERRCNLNEGAEDGSLSPQSTVFNPYTEFKEFSRKQIQDFQKTFNKYDTGKDKFIDFEELKHMMEKLGVPQTHLSLKAMIRQVDEDNDGKISFREFLLIFRKAAAGELAEDSGLAELYHNVSEIDVDEVGVKGAKNFFTAKASFFVYIL